MTDLIARSDGTFALLRDGKVFDLVHADGGRKRWVEVAVPFVAVKLALRGDQMLFAVDTGGALWQRLADQREHDGAVTTITAQWRLIARAPL